MPELKNPFISKVQIKNFRNFLDTQVELNHKQVIIGENNVGKTNFLRAIQLILDRDFSENDRELIESDFHDSIIDPMVNGAEIEITIQVQGYEHNRKLIAQFADAVISIEPPTLQFKYKYYPNKDEYNNIINYVFEIYKGAGEDRIFTKEDRSYLNIHVIKALRDVERELKANKNSPLYKLVKKYEISKDDLEDISVEMQAAAEEILKLDEIVHIKKIINERFASLSGLQGDNEITLRTFDIDTERLLYTLQVYMGIKERPVSELSLGLANILYISLMLILLKDRTIPPIIDVDLYTELIAEDEGELVERSYELSEKGKYILSDDISNEDEEALYLFMDEHNYKHQAFTILAVEEPEAHLHPVLQRLIFSEVLQKSATSVIFTSHSTHIASVAPINSIVNVVKVAGASNIYSTATLLADPKEKLDIERYIDAKRGEIYFGKGIILTEGITEEYVVPASANLLGLPLDDYGIVVCNIDSTNFRPYIQLLEVLHIPWILFTDGDYYETHIEEDPKTGEDKRIKRYHIMDTEADAEFGYRGLENIKNILLEAALISEEEIPIEISEQDKVFSDIGCFIGTYTFEVDMMRETTVKGTNILKAIYAELQPGKEKMLENFEEAIDEKDYWKALKKIENNISKGRFAQRLASELIPELIPDYIKSGIRFIVKNVKANYE